MLNIKEELNQLFTRNLKTGELFKIYNHGKYQQLLIDALTKKDELKYTNVDDLDLLKTSLSISTCISLEEWEQFINSSNKQFKSYEELYEFIFKQDQYLSCKLSFSPRSIAKFKKYYPSYEVFKDLFKERFSFSLLNNHIHKQYQLQIFKYIDFQISLLSSSLKIKKVSFKTSLNCDKSMLIQKLYDDFNHHQDSVLMYLSDENLYHHVIKLGCVSIIPSLETQNDLIILDELQLDNQRSAFYYGV